MKLTDILKEIEDEDGKKGMKVNYDLAVQPESIENALSALNDIENYGIYAQNMRDPKAIAKAFGPSIPAQKAGAAWKDWDSRSDEEKNFKIIDIKNREPEAWTETEEKTAAKSKVKPVKRETKNTAAKIPTRKKGGKKIKKTRRHNKSKKSKKFNKSK